MTEPSLKICMARLGTKLMKHSAASHYRIAVSQILKNRKICFSFCMVMFSPAPDSYLTVPILCFFTGRRYCTSSCLSVRACKSSGNAVEAWCQHSWSTLCELFDTDDIDNTDDGTNALLVGQQQIVWLQRREAFARCGFIVLRCEFC